MGDIEHTMKDEATSASSFVLEKVWDWPTRLFHWLLTISVIAGWYIGYYREFDTIEWHFYLGYMTGGLLVFRIIWGFIGPEHARFLTIFKSLAHLPAYLKNIGKRQPSGVAGHNPLGGLSVLGLLVVLAVQVSTGLFAEDDGLYASGPFSGDVESSWVLFANDLHHKASRLLLLFVGIHLAAILYYLTWKRENLVTAMITGMKSVKR